MKNISIYIIAVIFFSFTYSSENSDDNVRNKKCNIDIVNESKTNDFGYYGIETGIIEYEMNIMGMTTKMTNFFKDRGAVQCNDVITKFMGKTVKVRTLILGDFIYILDEKTKTGTKTKITEEENDNFDYKNTDFQKLSKSELIEKKIKIVGKEVIAGKNCTIYSIDDEKNKKTEIWIWKNIALKVKASEEYIEVETKAIKIIENPSFPEGIFEVPSNYKIDKLDLDNMNKQMEDAMMKNR